MTNLIERLGSLVKGYLLVFDIESTGLDTVKDRIISFASTMITRGGGMASQSILINPERPISEEITELTGISDAMVKDQPVFKAVAPQLKRLVDQADAYLGFNLARFDVPILWEELYRAGEDWELGKKPVIDAGTIFKKKEERTLAAALKFYCGLEHDAAHQAAGDVEATILVFGGQIARYEDLLKMTTAEQLAEASTQDKRLDLAGTLTIDKDGDPAYTAKRVRGVKVKHDPSFAVWMLRNDFSEETKRVLRKVLDSLNGSQRLL